MPSFPFEGSPHASVKLTPTIFHEPWWLSMVSRGKYHEARVYSAGKIVGRLPYVTARIAV